MERGRGKSDSGHFMAKSEWKSCVQLQLQGCGEEKLRLAEIRFIAGANTIKPHQGLKSRLYPEV